MNAEEIAEANIKQFEKTNLAIMNLISVFVEDIKRLDNCPLYNEETKGRMCYLHACSSCNTLIKLMFVTPDQIKRYLDESNIIFNKTQFDNDKMISEANKIINQDNNNYSGT